MKHNFLSTTASFFFHEFPNSKPTIRQNNKDAVKKISVIIWCDMTQFSSSLVTFWKKTMRYTNKHCNKLNCLNLHIFCCSVLHSPHICSSLSWLFHHNFFISPFLFVCQCIHFQVGFARCKWWSLLGLKLYRLLSSSSSFSYFIFFLIFFRHKTKLSFELQKIQKIISLIFVNV